MPRLLDDLVDLVKFGRGEIAREIVANAHEMNRTVEIEDLYILRVKQEELIRLYKLSDPARDFVNAAVAEITGGEADEN